MKVESKGPEAQQNRAIAYLTCSKDGKLCRNCDQKFNYLSCPIHTDRDESCESCQRECHSPIDALILLKRKILVNIVLKSTST